MASSDRVMPVGSLTSNHNFDALDADSYTAHRLKHASPEHLHITTRRFFIGPIPEGWLNSNRKSWYRRRVELSTYSSRKASFNAAAGDGPHHRTMAGLEGPSTAARMNFSFPQPDDLDDTPSESDTTQVETDNEAEESGSERETREIEPVSTNEVPQIVGIEEDEDSRGKTSPKAIKVPRDKGLDGTQDSSRLAPGPARQIAKSPGPEGFHTAQHSIQPQSREASPVPKRSCEDRNQDLRQSISNGTRTSDNFETSSKTPLLQPDSPPGPRTAGPSEPQPRITEFPNKSMEHHAPAPIHDDEPETQLGRTATGVRFKVTEGVANRGHRISRRVHSTRQRVANKNFRRNTLREGTIVKMEKMLVRLDLTSQLVPDEFDENESQRIESKTIERWREFMVVARKSKKQDLDDFRLQFYKTRVIPEIDDEQTSKKPAREIRLDPKTTHVNLYSSLDKTVVVWHPYKKGTRIVLIRPSSTAHSVEWYTFLRDAMGWKRPSSLQVTVPDLDLTLRLDRPFEGLEAAGLDATDEETALARTEEAEHAVAGRIISQCLDMLEHDPEWTAVLKLWKETSKMGLAWKRYDRLEWIHGMAEQKMYGSMAMQQTHDLELRPKHHYPTTAYGKKGVQHEEPPPVEGFLVRLTSQKGVHQRMGKAFFKRLYYYTQNQFLMFNRPAKATPPHPPRLVTISGTNVPSSHEIVEKTPETWDIEPFRIQDGQVTWLRSGNIDTIKRRDIEALEEARRNVANMSESDGYINMCRIRNVRKIKWGALPVDDNMEAGSDEDVDFHEDVPDSGREDGTTTEIDDNRTFELVLDNGLIIRLQAYSKDTRTEWMKRLRALVKYWKLRVNADMDTFKNVRRTNLSLLNIDEEMEAILGQFGRKWEVSRSEASPELYHMCGIASCRAVTMSGLLYRKPRRRSTFQRCSVILSGGKMLIYQATLRKRTGEQVRHIHQERMDVVDLRDCYVYSGLVVEDDLLYQNRTFDANKAGGGMGSLPRVYREDGWTSQDGEVMTCFVIWRNEKRGWFRTQGQRVSQASGGGRATSVGSAGSQSEKEGKRSKLKRVARLGVPGKGMVFKCRSRAERDHWVLSVSSEIERVVEREEWERRGEEVRLERGGS